MSSKVLAVLLVLLCECGAVVWSPENDATDVAIDAVVTLEFTQPPVLGDDRIIIRRYSDGGQVGNLQVANLRASLSNYVEVSGNTLTITPPLGLPAGLRYWVEVREGVITNFDYSTTGREWSFTTTYQTGLSLNEALPNGPYIPFTGSTNVNASTLQVMVIRMAEEVPALEGVGDFSIWKSSDNSLVDTYKSDTPAVKYRQTGLIQVFLRTPNLLEVGTEYYITVDPGFVRNAVFGITDSTTWTFTTANTPPVANADTATASDSQAVVIDVLNNDVDGDGQSLTITQLTSPTNGAATDNGDGTITYTSNVDYGGVDTFTYTITDGIEEATAQVTVTVTATFDILLVYINETSMNTTHIEWFEEAAARWESIITADLPSRNVSGQQIDDLLIEVSTINIDGPGGRSGYAGSIIAKYRPEFLPVQGLIEFDLADIALLDTDFVYVAIHEIGHILGLNRGIWNAHGLISGYCSDDGSTAVNYLGQHAVDVYRTLSGDSSKTQVPLESTGGAGTCASHWKASEFTDEMMAGAGGSILSILTIASLEDLGYSVDYNQADAYALTPGKKFHTQDLAEVEFMRAITHMGDMWLKDSQDLACAPEATTVLPNSCRNDIDTLLSYEVENTDLQISLTESTYRITMKARALAATMLSLKDSEAVNSHTSQTLPRQSSSKLPVVTGASSKLSTPVAIVAVVIGVLVGVVLTALVLKTTSTSATTPPTVIKTESIKLRSMDFQQLHHESSDAV